jgi:hypothetical protein
MSVATEKQAKKSKAFSITCMLTVEYGVEREVSCQLWSAQPASAKIRRDARGVKVYERLIYRSYRYGSQIATGSPHTSRVS